MYLLSLEPAACLAQVRPRREGGPAGKSRAVLMGVEAPQRAGLPKGRKARPCPQPGSTSGRREGEPPGRKEENQLSPSSWPPSDQTPGWRRLLVSGWGGFGRKQKCWKASPMERKEHQKSWSPGPSPQPPVRKSAKHYHKKGVSERPLAWAPEAHALAQPCPGHRVRRGRALDQRALVGDPRPARDQAGPRHAGAQWASPHTLPSQLRASVAHCLPWPEPPSCGPGPGIGWRWGAGRGWSEVVGGPPLYSGLGPVQPLPHPAPRCQPSA